MKISKSSSLIQIGNSKSRHGIEIVFKNKSKFGLNGWKKLVVGIS